MIHIFNTNNGQFGVITINSKNHEPLNSSESFTQKHNAWKNIQADMVEKNSTKVMVQDDTPKGKAKVYEVSVVIDALPQVTTVKYKYKMVKTVSAIAPEPKHVPKKKKTKQ